MLGIIQKLKFWIQSPRIGPDMPLTHFLLYSKRAGKWLGRRKLKLFSDGAEIRPHVYLVETKYISLGKNVVLRPGCKLFADPHSGGGHGEIIIEDNVLIGSDVHFYVSNHAFLDTSKDIIAQGHEPPKSIVVRRGAWIGAGATILPGVTIGKNSVVGAGSVVTKDIDDFCVAVGSPARVIRRIQPDKNK